MKSRFGTGAEESLTSPEGYASESDSRALRTLSEEIAREFAPRLEQTALVLYDRDPEYLQAQWYVTPQALAEACRLFPGDAAGLRQVLRLCRLDQDGHTQVVTSVPQDSDASEGAGEDGFALPGDGTEYSCELGLESDAGEWLLLARSNRVRLADRQRSSSQTTFVPDDPQARNAPPATAEEPSELGDIPVEAALAAIGEPLYPVFPNLESDDALPAEHPARPERMPGRTRPRDRRPESPSGIHQESAPHLKPDDVPSTKRPASLQETSDQAGPRDRGPKYPPGVPPYLVSYPKSGDTPSGHSVFLAEALRQETPGQAGSGDQEPEFPSGIPHDLAPDSETGAEPPADATVEAALAAVGGPLYPVFPDLEPDDAPPGHSAFLGEAPGRAWLQDRGPEFLSGILQDSVPYPETTADLPPGAHLVDMPPPLLPSSPGLSPTDAMPGPLYDPRATLSSAVLPTGALPPLPPDLEIHAELIVQGRAVADSTIDLFGHPIAVGGDGRFYIRRSIDISVLESLAAGGGLLPWQGTAGHG